MEEFIRMNELKIERWSMKFEKIIYEEKDGAAWITLNNPEKYNALDEQMRIELKTALENVGKREEIKVVVIKGAGKAFAAGADLKALLEMDVIDVSRFSDNLA